MTNTLLTLYGPPVLSQFRTDKLLHLIHQQTPKVIAIHHQYLHIVECKNSLSSQQMAKLQQLLDYGESVAPSAQSGQLILVTPRPGTISPWSSKATDIAHQCGLTDVIRIERATAYYLQVHQGQALSDDVLEQITPLLYDRMTQVYITDLDHVSMLFNHDQPESFIEVNILDDGIAALETANRGMGLALNKDEIDYLYRSFLSLKRNPSDVELMMFAQANSEHCRHKIFNASWVIDGQPQAHSLFGMIKNSYQPSDNDVLSAYKDNASVTKGHEVERFTVNTQNQHYQFKQEQNHILMKVETHNHPTAISPFPGAATGSGGEIRDEGATGRGSKPKAGLCGFSVSGLQIPDWQQPWELATDKPEHMASALDIMLEAPIGAASFNNEFGRPNLCGYFRTFEQATDREYDIRGYHKPIMIAGGYGNIRDNNVQKNPIPVGAKIIVLGGPAMLIGLGGGAASSMDAGSSSSELDFASVQRGNPEMQRRCQEVIDRCSVLDDNPIIAIHDVGAGGLSNAIPELVHDCGRGGKFELRAIPNDEPGLSPMGIWCNEAQERYVLAVNADDLARFEQIATRERCPYAVVGEATERQQLVLTDSHFNSSPIDLPMSVLFGNPPKMQRQVTSTVPRLSPFDDSVIELGEAVQRVLQNPTVADKSFLITIGDRSITGQVARDQMVGPWQIPVADVAVTTSGYQGYQGEAMAMGERSPIALINHAASARMAIGEAITNIASTDIERLSQIKLSANWMAAADYPGEDAGLYQAVHAVGMELCPALGLTIPVGKDSLSMRAQWRDEFDSFSVTSPLSLVISAFAPVQDVRRTLTPQLKTDDVYDLLLIDLGAAKNRMGASVLAQCYGQMGDNAPDVDDPARLQNFFDAIQHLNKQGLIHAYHDRSDGGLLTTLCEMGFAGHCGVRVILDDLGDDPMAILFNEELGAVIQVRHSERFDVMVCLENHNLAEHSHIIGEPSDDDEFHIYFDGHQIYRQSRVVLQQYWSQTSYHMQSLRDNPKTAQQAYSVIADKQDPGIQVHTSFDIDDDISAPYIAKGVRPKLAVFREQGVNGQIEMAAAFHRAGFDSIDVHMSDFIAGDVDLAQYQGLVACGGFSYGDVLGAGGGWAKSILFHQQIADNLAEFFNRTDTFALGVCNGCQMMAHLRELIPGATHWPRFLRNESEQFEARVTTVQIQPSPSILLAGMEGSRLPVVVAHGEGRAYWADEKIISNLQQQQLIAMQYVDNHGDITQRYPANPNGSPQGITGLTNNDGRVTILMPHPERVYRAVQNSWYPPHWSEDGPWMRLFRNARVWVD